MRFGLVKFCIPIDLEVLSSTSNSGVDDRYGLVKELISRGHEVIIFTPLVRGTKNNPREERWLLGDEENIPKTLPFLKNIGYAPAELPVGDFKVDVLIVEAGVGNTMFSDPFAKTTQNDGIDASETGLIRRFARVVDAHKGPVIYLHNDPSLPFYFRQMAGRKYPWGHKRNGYTNPVKENRGEKWVRDSAWGTFDEMFQDKKSVVVTRCLPENFEYMVDVFNSDRCGYKEFQKYLSFEYIPPAYSYELCEGYQFKEKIKYPLFYSGGDRRRRKSFRKFYEDIGVPTYVSGKWTDEAKSGFEGINFLGWVETRKDLLDHINDSGCVVQIQPGDASKMGWWTARTMETSSCMSMCFIDNLIHSAKDLVFDSWFVLKDKEDAQKKIKSFLSLNFSERIKIINTQMDFCKTYFTWQRFVDSFIAICKKNMVDYEVVRNKKRGYEFYLNEDSSRNKLSDFGQNNPVYNIVTEDVIEEVPKKEIILSNSLWKDIPKELFAGFQEV